jgi:hypothetical protein
MMPRPSPGRSVYVLAAANIALLCVVLVFVVSEFTSRQERVLSVERLNIVDSTGQPVLIIANGRRLPGAMFHGKEYPPSFVDRGRTAGMLFYNEVGDEVGGLVYHGISRDSGFSALGHLSFDQWQQSQVLALTYSDDGKARMAGLRVWDRPSVPLEEQFLAAERFMAATGRARDSLRDVMNEARKRVAGTQRVFVGSQDQSASIELRDPAGNVRVKLVVDSLGVAQLQFLNERGGVTAVYPRQ